MSALSDWLDENFSQDAVSLGGFEAIADPLLALPMQERARLLGIDMSVVEISQGISQEPRSPASVGGEEP